MLSFKKVFNRILAVVCVLAILVCGIPLTASAETAVPAINNTYPYSVFEKEGVVWKWVKYAGEGMTWQDCTYLNGGSNIDITEAKYLEFDLITNTSEVTNLTVWLSTDYGDSPARRMYNITFEEGVNHIVIDLSKYNNSYVTEAAPWDSTAVKSIFLQPFTISADIDFTFANVAFTTNLPLAPEMNNSHDISVFEKKGVFWTSLSATGNTAIANNAESYYPRVNGGNSVDTSKAKYIEFDVWSDVAVAGGLKFWLSSNVWAESGRWRYSFPALEAGWNHVVINIDACEITAEWDGAFDRTAVKGFFLEGTPVTAESVPLNLRFANVAFTYPSYPRPTVEHLQLRKGDGTEGAIYHPGGYSSPTRTFDADGQGWANNHHIYMPANTDVFGYDNISFTFSFENQAEYDVWKYHTYFYIKDSSANMVFYPMPTDLKAGDNTITLDLWLAVKNNVDLTATSMVGVMSVPQGAWHSSQKVHFESPDLGYTDTTEGALDFTFKITNIWANLEEQYSNIDDIDAGAYQAWGKPVGNFNWGNFQALSLKEPIDLSDYDYIDFDLYVSDADKLRAELGSSTGAPYWTTFVVRFQNSKCFSGEDTIANWWWQGYSSADIKTGYNHFRIPVSEIASNIRNDFMGILCYQESNGTTCSPEYNYVLGAVNFQGVNASAKIDSVYSDDMMFQQNKPIVVTGSGTKDAKVKVELIADKDGSVVRTKEITVGESEIWEIALDPLKASFDTYKLKFYIDGKTTPEKTVNNVIIGDLYVASGQSNMAMRMWETPEGADWYNNNTYGVNGNPNIRVFSMNDTYWDGSDVPYEPDRNAVVGYWAVGNEKDYYDTSAVAYNFADTMQKKLGIPVGVMDVSLGGSSIFSWISRDAIEADEELLAYLKSSNRYYDESNWGGANAQHQMTSLYNMKVSPVSSMYVSGAIWYQGCNEVGIDKGVYTNALKVLRKSFADTFNYTDGELPFILVELAPYGYTDPSLPEMWDQMTLAAETYENMGAITIYDLPLDWAYKSWTPGGWGIADPIHPYTKKPVGQRLATAMYSMVYDSTYGEATAPVWNGAMTVEGKYAYLDFDHVGDGLATPDGIALDGFSITNARGVFVNAKAEIVDKNTVKVWSDNVDIPVAVSYCYDNYSVTSNLYGTQNGDKFLPVAPFITTDDVEIQRAQNNSWYTVDDAKVEHFIGSKFGFYDAWTAEGATAEIVSDIKDYGDGSLKLSYNANTAFTASPTLTGADDAAFSDINYNYSFYDRIDFKVKNTGSALTLDKLALYSNGVWYYAEIDEALSADSGWVAVTADLTRLTDENGSTYSDSAKLSNVTKMQVVFTDVSGDGAVYVDTFQLGNSTYGEFKMIPAAVTTANVGSMGVGFNYGAVTNTAYFGDRYLMYNADGVDVSDSDYLEFDLYINDVDEVKRLKDLGYSFSMWISSSKASRFVSRCSFSLDNMIINTGWNHLRIAIDDITYKESGFTFEHLHYFYITCLNSANERTETSLYVKLSNFVHTVHAGDLTADGAVDMLDLVRMKKVQLGENVEYDILALDVDRNNSYESAVDFTALRKQLFESF